MKGKTVFTMDEIEQLRKLIVTKNISSRDEQVLIRNKMRKIGFYITDFTRKQEPFTVDDFDQLLIKRRISVV